MPSGESKLSLFVVRLVFGVIVGIIVASISVYIAWYNNVVEHYNDLLCREQMSTIWRLKNLDELVKEYLQKSNSIPKSLQVAADSSTNAPLYTDPFADGWNHSLHYSVIGSNYLITSYGEDGLPGGEGVDYDLTNQNPRPKERKMTFPQFLKARGARGMVNTSIFCGFVAAVTAMSTVKRTQSTDHPIASMVMRLLLTTIGAIIVGAMLVALHTPSGH
jgi:hypothetical protein